MTRFLVLLFALLAFPAWADSIDHAKAAKAFAERQTICDADQGKLWAHPLCGPMMFVEDASHELVANQQSQSNLLTARDGLFYGKLPTEIPVANTATDWDGVHWTMVEWPLPEEKKERDALLMHESWHRIQTEIGLPMRSPVVAHLSPAFGRIALRLEWRALATALRASDPAARNGAVKDALIFRKWRRGALKGAAESENQLELNEGLADYTGRRLSGQDAAAIAAMLDRSDHKSSFVRSFAYASGPAYGYLLDLAAPDWRTKLNDHADLGSLLASAYGVTLPPDVARAALAESKRYGRDALATEEHEAERRRNEQAKHWTAKLVKGPVLRLPLAKMQVRFDPNTLFPLPPHGTVYPTLEVSDEWGSLKASSGALIENWAVVILPASAREQVTLKPGWSWKIGARKGDLVASPPDH
jgi:hypothetical protein